MVYNVKQNATPAPPPKFGKHQLMIIKWLYIPDGIQITLLSPAGPFVLVGRSSFLLRFCFHRLLLVFVLPPFRSNYHRLIPVSFTHFIWIIPHLLFLFDSWPFLLLFQNSFHFLILSLIELSWILFTMWYFLHRLLLLLFLLLNHLLLRCSTSFHISVGYFLFKKLFLFMSSLPIFISLFSLLSLANLIYFVFPWVISTTRFFVSADILSTWKT